MTWCVVVFENDEVEAVPQKWIVREEEEINWSKCWWPVDKKIKKLELIKKLSSPEQGSDSWKQFNVRVLKKACDSYEEARRKCKKAEDTSDLTTDTDEGLGRGCRKRLLNEPFEWLVPEKKKKCTEANVRKEDSFNSSNYSSDDEEELVLPPFTASTPTVATVLQSTKSSIASSSPRVEAANDDVWKNKVTRTLSYLKLKIDGIVESLEIINSRFSNNQKDSDDIVDDNFEETIRKDVVDVSNFPLETEEELSSVEELITTNKAALTKLVGELSKLGGKTTKETTKRLLRRIFADKLAQNYSYYGFKKKKVFSNLRLNEVIFAAVRQNKETDRATQSEVEEVIKDWLRQAKARAYNKATDQDVRQNRVVE